MFRTGVKLPNHLLLHVLVGDITYLRNTFSSQSLSLSTFQPTTSLPPLLSLYYTCYIYCLLFISASLIFHLLPSLVFSPFHFSSLFSPFSSLPFSFFLLSPLPSFLVCVSEKKDPTSVAVRPIRTRDLNNVLLPASPAYSQSGNEDRIILPPRYMFKLFSAYYCLMIVKCHLGSMDKHLSVTDMCSQCTDIQSTASPVFCTRLKNTVTLYFILISSTICLLSTVHSHYSHYLSF